MLLKVGSKGDEVKKLQQKLGVKNFEQVILYPFVPPDSTTQKPPRIYSEAALLFFE